MKEINLKVEGMMCTGCENRIQNAEWNKECKGRPYDWNCKD